MPKSKNREAKRETIRLATYRCFREYGYQDTSVDKICKEAGISKGSFYWHYDSKQAVFVDMVEFWAREVMTEVFGRFEEPSKNREQLAAVLVDALITESRRGKAIVPIWMELSVVGQREPELRAALAKVYRRARSAIVEIMRPLTPGQSDEQRRGFAAAVFGVFIGIIMQGVVDPEEASSEVLFGGFMQVIHKWLVETDALKDP